MEASAQNRQPIRRTIGVLIFIVAVIGRSTLYAQTQAPVLTASAAREIASPVESAESVRLLVGRSTIVDVGKPIARVSLTSPDIADALVTAPNELLLNGKAAGTISMFVWDRAGAIRRYDVIVQRDLARLSAQLKELFPKESVEVRANGRTAVLSGSVSSKDVAEKMAGLAGSFVDNKEELVSLLQVGEAGRSNQVLLRVRFAEVSRSAMTDLGVSLFTGATGYKDYLARSTTDQIPGPVFDNSNPGTPKLVFSDFLNLFLFNTKEQLGGVIRALMSKGLFQSLAEPNLIAESGKEASFLAGGEFPVPVAQGSAVGGMAISVQFKEFGIRLTFTPIVTGNRVHLKVRPEVSTLDFTNAVVLNGFRIPALSTRRTETEIELNDGQTFAIAGLINNSMNSTLQKIPGIGDIPILGLLFKSKAAQKNQTELVVMITPEILPNNSQGVTPDLPRLQEPYLPPISDRRVVPMPTPAFKTDADTTAPAPVAVVKPSPADRPQASAPAVASPAASSAATMKANSSTTRTVIRTPDPKPTDKPAAAARPAPAAPAGAQPAAPEPELEKAAATASANRPVVTRLTTKEREEIERARSEERKRQELAAKAMSEEQKRHAKQAAIDQQKEKEDAERQARIDRAQAERNAEAARRDAERAKEQARKQAEIEKKHQKEISEAESRLRAAQDAYQEELSKTQGQSR
jgi:pilus assembly protein CpaC